MRRNGFTFIEILGVITLLALISMIVLVVVDKNLKDSKNVISTAQLENIRSAASMWMADNIERIPNDGYYTILLSDLQNNGYIDSNIVNASNNEVIDPNTVIRIGMRDILVGFETGFDSVDSALLAVANNEIDILNTVALNLDDGIYYYNSNGNLEKSGNIFNVGSIRNNPKGNVLIFNKKIVNACLNYSGKDYEYSIKDGLVVRDLPCSTVRGENLIVNGDLSYGNNSNFSQFTYNNDGFLTISSSTVKILLNDDFIPIDVGKKYEMGITAKSDKGDSYYYLGFVSYDIDKKEILARYVTYVPNSLTTLARDLNVGDEYIYLTDMADWDKTTNAYYRHGFIFWNYTDSTGYTYPELTYSRNVIHNQYSNENIEIGVDVDGEIVNRIRLNSPWSYGNMPSGTKLSQSTDGNTFNYNIFAGNMNSDFYDYSGNVFGVSSDGTLSNNKFRYGTKYIKILSLDNYNAKPNVTTSYKDFYIREVIE
ncbi:MAG: prepilin-type N-terminal cleavage/methylation domain-containing protein [Bacilli bacterium]|nr:prepilin-type N-terminal cleavage/methylation domain-containing protein [Bacilli bacterium]